MFGVNVWGKCDGVNIVNELSYKLNINLLLHNEYND